MFLHPSFRVPDWHPFLSVEEGGVLLIPRKGNFAPSVERADLGKIRSRTLRILAILAVITLARSLGIKLPDQ